MVGRRAIVGALVTVGSVLVVGASPAGALHGPVNQADETTTTGAGDENPLLVPGPDPDVAETDATPAADDAVSDDEAPDDAAVDDPASGSTNDEAEDTVRMVMFALIGVAVALTLLTIYYWWRTRPGRRRAEPSGGSSRDDDDSSTEPDDDSTVGAWQTDSTSTR